MSRLKLGFNFDFTYVPLSDDIDEVVSVFSRCEELLSFVS